MGIDNLRKKNNITAPVSRPDKNITGGTPTTAAPVKKKESGQSRSGDPGAGTATGIRTMGRNNSGSGSGDAGGTVGPGIYTGLPTGSSTGSGSGSGSGGGHSGGSGGGSSYSPDPLIDSTDSGTDATKDYLSGLVGEPDASTGNASDWAVGAMQNWGKEAGGQLAGNGAGDASA